MIEAVLAAGLVLLLPIYARLSFARLQRAVAQGRTVARRRGYQRAMAVQWSLAAFVSILWWARGRSWESLGLTPFTDWRGVIGVGVMLTAAILTVVQWHQLIVSEEVRREVREQLENVEAMLPHDDAELRWASFLSLTAGICEELLYRGFLIWWLGQWIPNGLAVLASSLAFGVAHAYQGPKGIIKTGIIGLVMGCLLWGTGALWVPIGVHALIDINACTMAAVVFSEPTSGEAS